MMENEWTKKIEELEAENKRLVALNDTFPPEIARLEDRVSAEYEAERADDSAKIEELKKENKRLRELVDGATVAVELFKDTAPAQKKWREEWLNKAREALKEASHD
jgi:archaellum component FlaC